MSFRKSRILNLVYVLFLFSFCFTNTLYGQKSKPAGVNTIPKKFGLRQDTIAELKKRNVMAAEPDTNFTWEKYAAFLHRVSDTSKYVVLPLNEFRQTFNSKKIVIGLRHDVDNDLNLAYQFSEIESKLGFHSTYFILHTASYYLSNSNNMSVHAESIIPILKTMQNEKHFEIGWHNDLVTLQVIYNINPVTFLHSELKWLRSNGINIVGTASHGSNYCKVYHYLNYYFFEECTLPVAPNFDNNITVPKDGKLITLIKGKLSDFDLQYEAYFLNNNKYFSDAKLTNGVRWNIGMLDLNQLQTGDRAIILLHPIHWHRASVHANIEDFNFPKQKSCSIDTVNSVISVEMPYATDNKALIAGFTLSPGAYAKVAGKKQVSRNTSNNFDNPLIYRVYAENREIQKEWTIIVHNTKNLADFISPTVPGLIGPASIDTIENTVTVLDATGSSKDEKLTQTGLLIYPNPSDGRTHMHFVGVNTSSTTVDIFNSMGEKVFTEKIKKTGDFTIEPDLKKLCSGVYIIRYSEAEKPGIIVIKKH